MTGALTPSRPRARWIGPVLFTVAVILLIELGRRALGLSEEATLPSLGAVLGESISLIGDSTFWVAIANTFVPWLIALAISIAIGVPLGFFIGSNRWVRSIFTVPVEVLRPIPSVALIPLTVIWLGATGATSKIFLATFAALWPLLYQARYGAGQIDPVLDNTARSYNMPFLARVRHVILPSMAPFIATGVRLSAAIALILVVSSELLIGGDGIGVEINDARQGADLPRMYALTAASGLLGWVLAEVLKRVEARTLFWHPSQRAGAS